MTIAGDITVDGGNDSVGHSPREFAADGISDGDTVGADLQLAGVGKRGGSETLCLDLQHRDITDAVGADESSGIFGAVLRGDGGLVTVFDDVGISHDQSVRGQDDAGPEKDPLFSAGGSLYRHDGGNALLIEIRKRDRICRRIVQ